MSMSGLKFTYDDMKDHSINSGDTLFARIYLNTKVFQNVKLRIVRIDGDGIACEFEEAQDQDGRSFYHFLEFLRIAARHIERDNRRN